MIRRPGLESSVRGADYFDLESPIDRERLATPGLALEALRGLVVIDEIQRQPRLFELLRPKSYRLGTRAEALSIRDLPRVMGR